MLSMLLNNLANWNRSQMYLVYYGTGENSRLFTVSLPFILTVTQKVYSLVIPPHDSLVTISNACSTTGSMETFMQGWSPWWRLLSWQERHLQLPIREEALCTIPDEWREFAMNFPLIHQALNKTFRVPLSGNRRAAVLLFPLFPLCLVRILDVEI